MVAAVDVNRFGPEGHEGKPRVQLDFEEMILYDPPMLRNMVKL